MPWIINLASRRKKSGPGRGPDGILVLRNGDSDTMNILLCQLLDPRIDPIDDFTDAFRPDTIRLPMEFVETSGNHLQRHVLVQRYVLRIKRPVRSFLSEAFNYATQRQRQFIHIIPTTVYCQVLITAE